MQDEMKKQKIPIGIDTNQLGVISPATAGIYDNYIVKK